jgi:hypothetical protein
LYAQERKRIIKARGKSDNKQSEDTLSLDKSQSKGKESCSKRRKKTEQYKNQVIVDQYGVFEYDKDPEGYKRARKRQQNRESALRARDKRTHKMETVEVRLIRIEKNATNLEKENLVLKAEKQQLQDQVKNLLSLLTSFGQNKRFKTGEMEELGDKTSTDNMISSESPIEIKEPSEFDYQQSDYNSVDLSPRNGSPEKQMLKLMRSDDSLFDQEEGGYGDLFQKGMMLSLTIVM